MRVISGRGFRPDDGLTATAVGVVTAPFARDHFEDGRPLGKRIRLGGPGDRWLTVVGVVEPLPYQAPGSAPPGDAVLYLPLAQHAAERVVWAIREASERSPEPAPAAAVRVAGDAITVAELRQRARAPLRWFGWTLLAAGVTGLALALGGAAEVAGAEARGRWREASVRAAVGAPPHQLVLRFLRRVTATALLASAVGWILAWSLVASAGRGAALEPAAGLGLAGLLLVATLAGAARPARHAARADPAVLLREGG
jgi:hypothetical protein